MRVVNLSTSTALVSVLKYKYAGRYVQNCIHLGSSDTARELRSRVKNGLLGLSYTDLQTNRQPSTTSIEGKMSIH